MIQEAVSPNQGDAFSWIVGLLTLGLAAWLVYEAWLEPPSTLTVTQEVQAKNEIQKDTTLSAPRLPSHVYSPTYKAGNSSILPPLSASELLEQLTLWQYQQVNTLSADDIRQIQMNLTQLASLGESAIPVIYQYLNSGQDVDYLLLGNSRHLDQPTLRLALFDVLHRIGGDDAETIWAGELERTASPREIAALGQYLDEQAPGLYREDIVNAAKDAMALASMDGGNGENMGPLFQVLQAYGDENVLTDLESVRPLWWGKYASVALASLPDGIGIPGLVNGVVDSPKTHLGSRFALQMLAQSAEYPEAQIALINSTREQQIPDRLWQEFAWMIAGTYRFQIEEPNTGAQAIYQGAIPIPVHSIRKYITFSPGGGQVLYGVRYATPQLTSEQIMPRLDFIETLLSETSSPAAVQALEQAYEMVWSVYTQEEQ
ncbi:hypothetical protein [Oceanimonas marisflavi]|uniref:hypothetical protein n=1 Tax=Oceanimonas marisflavi TaxID=2059724 RepID=UPI000D2F80D0|nr:hypothetical protein [Oceanimonas marisflavi]